LASKVSKDFDFRNWASFRNLSERARGNNTPVSLLAVIVFRLAVGEDDRTCYGMAAMDNPDNRPLSDNQADDRLKAALAALGSAPGKSVHSDTALKAARKALSLLSLGLIGASLNAENRQQGEEGGADDVQGHRR
jgi:hypothetical protein